MHCMRTDPLPHRFFKWKFFCFLNELQSFVKEPTLPSDQPCNDLLFPNSYHKQLSFPLDCFLVVQQCFIRRSNSRLWQHLCCLGEKQSGSREEGVLQLALVPSGSEEMGKWWTPLKCRTGNSLSRNTHSCS